MWVYLAMAGDGFGCHHLGGNVCVCAAGILGRDIRDVTKCPPMCRAAATTRNDLAPNISRADVGKPWVLGVRKDRPTASSDFDSGAGGTQVATWVITGNHSCGST